MTKVCVTFEGDDWYEVTSHMCDVLGLDRLPSGMPSARTTAKSEPEPEPEPRKSARSHKSKPALVATSPVEKEPEPVTTATPAPAARTMPPLDVLKQAVTTAVRAAQKSEGPKTILEMLPLFKKETGLDFVMNAQEEHREALFELVEAAGLIPA
jgi:hypothetical protein